MTNCAFCNEDKKLIDAHIIPKWVFKYLYPNETYQKQPLILVEKGKTSRRPIGPYDQGILCKECDNFLGLYDEYAKKIFLDQEPIRRTENSLLIKDVDFQKLQLFFISVLWRASISTRTEFMSISIGPHENLIKKILNENKRGIKTSLIQDYLFVVTKFEHGNLPKDLVNKNIKIPNIERIGPINIAVLYLPKGLKIILKIDKRPFVGDLNKLANYHKEGLIIALMGNYADSHEFKTLIKVS